MSEFIHPGGEYMECYEKILRAEKELREAKILLVKGDSPYTSLSICENLTKEARTAWHIWKEKQDAQDNSD